jgi:serine/threonine protein phosphatase PrpC
VIVRALGMKETVLVDLSRHTLQAGDVFISCSDGLSGMVTDEELLEVINTTPDLQEAVTTLINKANEAGGVDNITVVTARIDSL